MRAARRLLARRVSLAEAAAGVVSRTLALVARLSLSHTSNLRERGPPALLASEELGYDPLKMPESLARGTACHATAVAAHGKRGRQAAVGPPRLTPPTFMAANARHGWPRTDTSCHPMALAY